MTHHRITSISDSDYNKALAAALGHLKAQGRITNRDVRSLTELRYDQVIKLFNRAIDEGHIERRGQFSGTHYVLAERVGN